jgi:long-chain acyl-CoA synthetase
LLKLNEKTKHLSLHNLKFIGCGSSFLPIDTQVRFKEIFNLSIANLYGLSETGPTHFDNPKSKNWKPGSIGIPLSVNQCKIAQDGEILIRGKNVFAGYHKNHKLFKRVVKNKWFHTGDYGKKENGKFFYLDRKKDIAIIGGMNVYPAEIEEVLQQIDQVSEACVFGVKDKINGEYLVAYIILKDSKNPNISNESIYKHLRENLSNFKVPREVFFVKKFPKTASGKVLKRELKERYIQEKTHE